MLAFAAGESGVDFSVVQWLIGLSVPIIALVGGLFVARALHGRALNQLESWKKTLTALLMPSRLTALEGSVQELKDADLDGRLKDVERIVEETSTWRQEATQQLAKIEKEDYAEEKVKAALAEHAESSTSRGTMSYPKAKR